MTTTTGAGPHTGAGVLVMAQSRNQKTGPQGECAVSYVSQRSCPPSCAFLESGGYAEHGPVGIVTRRLNRQARRRELLELAKEEAKRIDALPADRPLRVHAVGDCRTVGAARLVGAAMVRYAARGATFAWTYTHAWRTVPIQAWQGAEVLASCEHPAEIAEARARGYVAALVVPTHPGRKVYELDGERILPCPEEQGGPKCAWCGLCARTTTLRARGFSIGFQAHGSRKATVAKTCGG